MHAHTDISRRCLMVSAAALVPVLAVIGCAGTQANIAQWAQDAQTIDAGLKGALTNLGTMNVDGMTPALATKINGYLTQLDTLAAQIQAASNATVAQPTAQQIAQIVNAIVAALAGLPLPPAVSGAVIAASVLAPAIETAVGLTVAPAASRMSPDEARRTLRAAAR